MISPIKNHMTVRGSIFAGHAGLTFRKGAQSPIVLVSFSVVYLACGWMTDENLPMNHHVS